MAFTTFDPATLGTGAALSAGNLTVTSSTASATGALSITGQTSGKYYVEFTLGTITGTNDALGIAKAAASYATLASAATGGFTVNKSGAIYLNGTSKAINIGALTAGAVVGMAIDLDNGRGWFRLGASGNWNANVANTPATASTGVDISAVFTGINPAHACAVQQASGDGATANFGAAAFAGTVPTGFTAGWPDTATATNYALISQTGIEVWANGTPSMVASQMGIEVWCSVSTVSATGFVCIMA